MKARSYVFTYPFWIVVDTQSPPSTAEINAGGYLVRLYPPFRSGPANFIPMPAVNPNAIPFVPGTKPEISPALTEVSPLAALPVLGLDDKGRATMRLAGGLEWGQLANMREFPMDSLRVDIVGSDELDENVADEAAKRASRELMLLLRWRSRQWWVSRSVDALAGYLRVWFTALGDGWRAFCQDASLQLPSSPPFPVLGSERDNQENRIQGWGEIRFREAAKFDFVVTC